MVTTINPAECDRTTVYTGECRNFQDTEWIRFDSGRRRSPNAPDGNTWLIDVAYGSFWMRDDQVRNLVRLVPAREVTRDDLPDVGDMVNTFLAGAGVIGGTDNALDAVVAHLNANGGLPASREDAALADRLERQAATISELQGSFLRVERDADRWRRAHAIVEQERDQARRERDEWKARAEAAEHYAQAVSDSNRDNADRASKAERERDEALEASALFQRDVHEWRTRAEAAEARTVTREDVEKAIRDALPPSEMWEATAYAQAKAVFSLFGVEAEPADPVEQKAAELYGAGLPVGIGDVARWDNLAPGGKDMYRRIAAHVLGQGGRHA